jgi:hypothetical protein
MSDRVIYRYVRDFQKNPIAVVACTNGMVGWSCCCSKDEFNKQRGKQIALERAVKGIPIFDEVKKRMKIPDYRIFLNYKGEEQRLVDVVCNLMTSVQEKSLEFAKKETEWKPQSV